MVKKILIVVFLTGSSIGLLAQTPAFPKAKGYLDSLWGEHTSLVFTIPTNKVHDFVVAQDGTGDFFTINEAIDASTDDGQRNTIFIKKGVYQEKVFIGNRWQTSNKVISLIGANVDSVVIIWDDYQGKVIPYPGKTGTIIADGTTCPTLTVTSPEFYMENITVKNPSTVAQAVALYQSGDRQVLKNCKILGNQDTHRTKKGRRYFYFLCTIEGGVDFIYAGGTCYFYQCDIVSNRNGYITAPEDIIYTGTLSSGKTLRYGFFFKDCDILAKEGVSNSSVYLGRPWQPECGSIFLQCRLGNHIHPKGWTTFGAGNEETACFAEYQNMNADGSELADVSQRVDWSIQVTTEDINNLMLLSKIYAKVSSTNFDPVPMVVAPDAPGSFIVDSNYLEWPVIEDAIGYVVYADGSVIGFNDQPHFLDTLTYDFPPLYTVRSVGPYGNLSAPYGESENFTIASIIEAIDTPLEATGIDEEFIEEKYVPKIIDGIILFDQPISCQVFSIDGRKIMLEDNILDFDLNRLGTGIFVFVVMDNDHKYYLFKVSNVQN